MSSRDALKEIVEKKRERINLARQQLSEDDLKTKIQALPATRSFTKAINKTQAISLIAEIKKQSPSRGIIRADFNPQQIAGTYQQCGAQAISVLTEEDYFAGNIAYINEIKSLIKLPILRKDFIFEPYQVYESRLYGADAILLIAELFSQQGLSEFLGLAADLGLDCLVEVHSEKDLKKALKVKAGIIGINNRNLHTLEVDFKITEKLFPLIPEDKTVVVESGIKGYSDILFLKILGVKAVLIGEAIMVAEDIQAKIKDIMGW
jgi:indole-3-glycerol phosphate synthase